jgi:peptidoglycan/xylan/chitin deacetylase (PgdA/CDA1 family)
MRRVFGVLLLAVLVPAALAARPAPAVERPAEAHRRVAVTFDDLPGTPPGLVSNDVASVREMTKKLLSAVTNHRVPATGFVTTGNLHVSGAPVGEVEERLELLALWMEAGLRLGNHSHSHRSLNRTPLNEFKDDVVHADGQLESLMAGHGRKMKFFRHPFLHVGTDLDKRRSFESWLRERGYRVAPVTMDNDDYIYAAAYAAASRRGETELARRLAEDYVRYMAEVFEFFEKVEMDVVGRPISHVLLLHANALNGDHFDRLAEMIFRRGYAFVSLEEALEDPAYDLPDTWVGKWGLSWLHHWALTAGKDRAPDPDPPQWVMEAYNSRNR